MDKNKTGIIVVVVGSIIVLLVMFLTVWAPNNEAEVTPTPTQKEADKMTVYTSENVAVHNSEDDCWIIIDNIVYDVTSFISKHPGGRSIVPSCGADATVVFNSKPNSHTPHSERARSLADDYKIGVVEEISAP